MDKRNHYDIYFFHCGCVNIVLDLKNVNLSLITCTNLVSRQNGEILCYRALYKLYINYLQNLQCTYMLATVGYNTVTNVQKPKNRNIK